MGTKPKPKPDFPALLLDAGEFSVAVQNPQLCSCECVALIQARDTALLASASSKVGGTL